MGPERRKPSGREKNEASVKFLDKLQEQLYSSNASNRRQAAFNLSWMQEDGLEILTKALFGHFPATTKNAAAYGLRKMRGRMKKMALEVLQQGLQYNDRNTRGVCRNALSLLGEKIEGKSLSKDTAEKSKFKIREIPSKGRPQRRISAKRTHKRKPVSNRGSFRSPRNR